MDIFYRALQHLHRRGDGDSIDHLSATTTVTILIVGALVVSAKQYVFQPIQCWVPAFFTQAMEQYTENYCYVQNTYWIGDMSSSIPEDARRRETTQLSYYQWVPFILLGQAALFFAPRIVWRSMSGLSGIDFCALHTMAHECLIADVIRGDNLRRALVNYLISAIELNRSTATSSIRRLCPLVAFLATKALFLANAASQLFLLNAILDGGGNERKDVVDGNNGVTPIGLNLIRNLINGTDWSSSGMFPRITLCDFEIRVLGNIHRHTVQCVLMINMFNEKLYASLWIWTLMVALATLASLLYWTYQLCLRQSRYRFVARLLPKDNSGRGDPPRTVVIPRTMYYGPEKRMVLFVDEYLNSDGVFLLRSIDSQLGSVLASQLIVFMYEQFLTRDNSGNATNGGNNFYNVYGSKK